MLDRVRCRHCGQEAESEVIQVQDGNNARKLVVVQCPCGHQYVLAYEQLESELAGANDCPTDFQGKDQAEN